MLKRSRGAAAGVLLAVAVGAGCGRGGAADERLTVVGSSTVAPVMAEIAKRFEEREPGTRVDVQAGGSGRGIADVSRGVADIGMVSRELVGDERSLEHWTIARDGVALIVHADNPVERLTDAQIVAIYTGEIRSWAGVGGADAAIVVVHKAEGRATQDVFVDYFGLDARRVRPDIVVGHNRHGIKAVAGNAHAIGYVSIGAAEAAVANAVPIRLLPLGGVAATTGAVASGRFPLSRPLNLVTRDEPDGVAAELLGFAFSEESAEVIREQHFVPAER